MSAEIDLSVETGIPFNICYYDIYRLGLEFTLKAHFCKFPAHIHILYPNNMFHLDLILN